MAGHSAAVFEDSQGQETPVGFRDLPGQWYTANHRKRGTSPRLGEQPTQRDSQATQVVSEGLAPVFVAALPSQEEDIGVQRSQHDGEDVDEEETQIRMSMSEDQEGAVKAERKIFEQAVPLPLTSTASGGRNGADGAAQAVDSDDADSDMSDDMLEQDGSIKSIACVVYETNIEKATHVLVPQNKLKRTVKLLCGISCCTHILGQRWLDESARVGASVSEQANCLLDEAAEAKWQFSLRRTMYGIPREQRMHLFSGHNVFITAHKSVQPPVKDLMKIVECAGGKASSKGKPGPNDLVITSEAAMGTAAVKKQLAVANPERIYSTELILSSILQQEIALDKNRLERPMTDTNKRRI
ncbi:hypothetical protein BBO99_00001689 [Phytophthora kernoviae]|uniref:BRCT domain-containing protein n=2 Tax=Phytophthora kernoviae TaxID=325452 RepID=A0A3R7I0H1_9STRA|nr:hypothetical protein G195_005077 [Phytophthora kernoviae 00238/432]KAG2525740.1 hypothetical protein JM16_003983 [Phytophthora kernoviae]KAG2527342.1 hypothetical protein JM18_003824 [Phytophthora kernoviae]RLN31891.1 hypothetical protein BBI17_000461 [Phytophthora kernoviae]RLN83942.1 hypothetical protein BBO99_00001689 [Phytophthora kernoviae]